MDNDAAQAGPRILIAPDKFKGTVTALDVATALADGIRSVLPEARLTLLPLADGGDGSVDAALSADAGFEPHTLTVTGALGGTACAPIALSADATRAVVEVTNCAGLAHVPHVSDDTARDANSLGFGEAVAWAVDRVGADHAGDRGAGGGAWPGRGEAGSGGPGRPGRVVAAIGGSCSTDGGAGLLHALGLRFYDRDGAEFIPSGGTLAAIDRVEVTDEFRARSQALRAGRVELEVACDVTNPLLGERGAAAVFGPQKGAAEGTVAELDAGLAVLVSALEAAGFDGAGSVGAGDASPRASDAAERPGAGAAGGLGFALHLLGATFHSGADYFLDLLRFHEHAEGADVVVTGEGSLDDQTLDGKLPAVVAATAARVAGPDVRVVGVAGRVLVSDADARDAGIHRTLSLTDIAGRSTAGDRDGCVAALREAGALVAREVTG